jgi:predicted ATPase/DNA-binding CsgD family transcriptional regulator
VVDVGAVAIGQTSTVAPDVGWQGLDREMAASLGVTRREDEVLDAVVARLSNAEIAAKLFISERTVESHVSALLRRLGAKDRSELIERARALTADGSRRDESGRQGLPFRYVRRGWRRPATGSSLIARDDLIAEVADHVGAGVLLTLVGVGGVGKTRLAGAVADRVAPSHGEQVAWIDLTTLAEGSAIVYELAGLLGVRTSGRGDLTDMVAAAIGDRDLVLVIDNCEHVLGAVRELIGVLLERCPGLAVLATSRERVGLTAERVVPVGPLGHGGVDSPAVDLLVERVGVPRSGLDGAELAVLAEIARRLDGIPLALELVAARCGRLGIIEVGRRLPGHLGRLSDPGRAPRHQTLDATVDWSYGLLGPAEQALLRSLAVFSATFDLDAVEAVAGGDSVDVESIVGSLVDKSLLERDGRRFQLLEMTREFAAHRLLEAGNGQEIDAGHRRYVKSRLVEILEGLHGRDEAVWVEQLDVLWPDVRAVVKRALDNDDADAAIEFVTYLAPEAAWRRIEAFAWIEEAAARWGDRPGPHRHELLGAACMVASHRSDVPEAIRLAPMALTPDPNPAGAVDYSPQRAALGAFIFAGRYAEAEAIARRAVATLRTGTDRYTLALLLADLTIILGVGGIGDSDEYKRAVEESLTVAYSTANPTAIAYAYFAASAQLNAEPARTRAALERARAYAGEVDNLFLLTMTATLIAMVPLGAQPDAVALAIVFDAIEDLHRTGWTTNAWFAMWGVIPGLFDLGHTEAAAMVLGGCESSGVSRAADHHVPSDLENESSATAPYRHFGRQLRFDDLVAIADGRRPLPLLS